MSDKCDYCGIDMGQVVMWKGEPPKTFCSDYCLAQGEKDATIAALTERIEMANAKLRHYGLAEILPDSTWGKSKTYQDEIALLTKRIERAREYVDENTPPDPHDGVFGPHEPGAYENCWQCEFITTLKQILKGEK